MKVTLKNRNGTKRVIDNANCLIVRVPSLAPGLADEIVVDSSEVASIHLDGPVVAPPPDQLEVEDREFDMSVYSRDGQREARRSWLRSASARILQRSRPSNSTLLGSGNA